MSKMRLAKELAEKIRENGDGRISAEGAKVVIEALVEIMMFQLASSGEFVIPGFGKLKAKEKAERNGVNPKTGEKIQISARKVLTIKPRQHVLALLNG